MATAEEWAWATGLFEGEGSIYSMDRTKDGHHQLPVMRLSIQMTDRDVLDKFHSIVQCGGVYPHKKARAGREHHKPTWSWVLSRRSEIERLLLEMLPWLCERRGAKARSTLAEIATLNQTCEECGTVFRSHRITSRFCSVKCRNRWNYLNRRPAEPSGIGRPRTI
jgi:ribosomal protein L32